MYTLHLNGLAWQAFSALALEFLLLVVRLVSLNRGGSGDGDGVGVVGGI